MIVVLNEVVAFGLATFFVRSPKRKVKSVNSGDRPLYDPFIALTKRHSGPTPLRRLAKSAAARR